MPAGLGVMRVNARRRDAGTASVGQVTRPPADPTADFAVYVRQQVDGPLLRYSQRLALIDEARRRGIGRFDANLVIASVLHAKGIGRHSYGLEPKPAWIAGAITFLVVQSMIAVGLGYLLWG